MDKEILIYDTHADLINDLLLLITQIIIHGFRKMM